ncbi:MAG: YidC/Oxa1 family membrane protein insertase [Clostridia bacterium]|nr:YidC/Oxa1 family membrane protein insertase [Clostridia bacterium]
MALYNWFYDYISPIFGYIMLAIYKFVGGVGGYGLALILFTILARTITLPTTISQQRGMAKQQRLAPKIRRIQERYAGNQQKIQEETQALYQREGYNPMSAGCLPMLIQMPIIIGLFGVMYNPLRYALGLSVDEISIIQELFVKFAEASPEEAISSLIKKGSERYYPMYIIQHFDLFKDSLAGKVSTETIGAISEFVAEKKFEIFGLQLGVKPNFKEFNRYWIIPILSGLTSFAQTFIMQAQQKKMNPSMAKAPGNGCMTVFMPLMSVYFTFLFPAGIGVYWIVSNIYSTVQSYLMKKFRGPQVEIAKLMVKETIERRSRENSLKQTADYTENK